MVSGVQRPTAPAPPSLPRLRMGFGQGPVDPLALERWGDALGHWISVEFGLVQAATEAPADGGAYVRQGGVWARMPSRPWVALSDETTPLVAGVGAATWHVDDPMAPLVGVAAGLTTASSSGVVAVDVEALLAGVWTSIFAGPGLLFAPGVDWVGASPALAVTALARGTKMRGNIDSAGTGATGLKLYFSGRAGA